MTLVGNSAYTLGKEAFANAFANNKNLDIVYEDECPYPISHPKAKDWRSGFDAAMALQYDKVLDLDK